jgi:hypothetical protein
MDEALIDGLSKVRVSIVGSKVMDWPSVIRLNRKAVMNYILSNI